jgi:hypothetical protein
MRMPGSVGQRVGAGQDGLNLCDTRGGVYIETPDVGFGED